MKFFLGTSLYTAYFLRKAPGTSTSLVVFSILYFVSDIKIEIKLLAFVLATITHFFCFPYFVKKLKLEDPSIYTLDETCAVLLINCFVNIHQHFIVAFILFRFFDILKPLGIKKVEKLPNISATIRNLGDDIIAALYTIILIIFYENIM